MKKTKIAVVLVALLLLNSILLTGCKREDSKDEITLKIAHYYAVDHPVNRYFEEVFKQKVESETNGSVKVQIYPNSQLGDEQEFVEGVQLGTVEMALTGNLWENTVPEFRIMQMPFMFVNYDHANAVLNGPIGQKIYEYLEPLNVKVLASFPNGFRVISNNRRPINSIDDIPGIKMRVFQGETIIKLMNILGFETIVLPISELFTSLQQGVVDGQDNPLATSFYNGYYEVQKYVAITNHMYSPGYIVINNNVWNKLTKEQQKIIENAAKETAFKIKEAVKNQEEQIIQKIEEQGIVVTYPDLLPFIEKVSPLIDEYINSHPHTESIIKEIKELANEYLK
ncbi:tripartite ATP-independent transporter solute receptor, DctP family [Anaerobranca californiensis DSM 14826]|jgi:tripartite ATP-independent transporter DctP family solute receptor|uniref:Tripartite ATP-independent transporter solute receptor, DctP family n=1 Tax=Anaerobranca californiensis DSM 14826 TaxID=1120989 RepID=A0A1M6K7G6_9FIRM|nr:TRAP transporter substrate-binding protein [Anaerobranca californiensis]SHJ54938.1 tripartite ATP-independent transporter solute receptor, DctP family [Anaerobranca californiensis DSM 14826]